MNGTDSGKAPDGGVRIGSGKQSFRLLTAGASLLALALGIFLVVVGLRYVSGGGKVGKWALADGRILSAEIAERESMDAESKMVSRTPIIRYEYEVEGKRYESQRVSNVGLTSNWSPEIDELLGRYPAGSEVWVFYDPSDPSSAVLEPVAKLPDYARIMVGLLLIVLGIGGLIRFCQPRRGRVWAE